VKTRILSALGAIGLAWSLAACGTSGPSGPAELPGLAETVAPEADVLPEVAADLDPGSSPEAQGPDEGVALDTKPADPAGDGEVAGTDPGPTTPSCRRSTVCGPDATCNLCSGRCEDRAPDWGTKPAVLSVYPNQGAPGDLLVVDGSGFMPLATTAKIGGASIGFLKMDVDENRLVIPRPANATGPLSVTSKGTTTLFDAPIVTDASFATLQPCGPDDPPATGVAGAEAAVCGPYAAGFVDVQVNGSAVRVFYPATCGGLRRPPAEGKFPFTLILHGDGCVALDYEYLARHLASWGFLAAIPSSVASWDHQVLIDKGTKSPQDWLPALAGRGAGGQAVVFCHSMGAERTLQLLSTSAPVQAVVFLGPVYTTSSPYGQSLFPVPGLVIGGTQDGQSSASTFEGVYDQLSTPKYLATLQGGDHSQFTDDKLWEGTPNGTDPGILARNRQFELVQSLSLAFLQQAFGQPQPFSAWLTDPGLPAEVVFKSQL